MHLAGATGRLKAPPGPGGRPRTLTVWIDPPTGRLLGMAEPGREFVAFMHQLHGNLLVPGAGRKVVGWLGWAMFSSCVTGLWLWWPRHGGFLSGLRWRRGVSQLFNLHHTIGFWICAPLAVLSLTGVYIAFPQTARALFGISQPQQPQQQPGPGGRFAPPLAKTGLGISEATRLAQAEFPGARVVGVTLPIRGPQPTWRVELKGGGTANTTVQVVDATAAVKAGRGDTPGPGGGAPLSRWMRRVHDGSGMGLVWQVIIFLGGVAPAVLSITGVVMWLRRRARKRQLAKA